MNVSVCIPTYNQAQYVVKAVRSAFNQSVLPIEIIVSDDCSTDDTAEAIAKLSAEIPILRVVYQPVNLGIARNTDVCLRLAIGDYVVRLDSDDLLAPTYIEKLATLLRENPDAGYAHAAVQEIDQHGAFLLQRRLFRKSGFQSADDALRGALTGYRVAANIIMFRRTALSQVNYVTSRPNYVEDYHLSVALAVAGLGNVYLNEVLSFYRVWVDTGRMRQRRKLMEIRGYTGVFGDVMEPAYKKKGWNVSKIHRRRTAIACQQSDCLSWDVYTRAEKEELAEALNRLSPAIRAKQFAWLYLNGFGKLLDICPSIMLLLRLKVKTLLLSFKN